MERLTIEDLSRKIGLLDEYASTLQRQNLAKNTQTQTLYRQLHQLRIENEILKNHIQRQQSKSIKSIQNIHFNQVSCSVEFDKIQANHLRTVMCQTQQFPNQNMHRQCIKEVQSILNTLKQKQNTMNLMERQANQMYNTITKLQSQNQNITTQFKNTFDKLNELEYNNKQKSQQLRVYSEENSQLRSQLKQAVQAQQNYQMNFINNSNKTNTDRQSSMVLSFQVERLIKENNKMIEKIRMLERQKNSYYKELRSVSPLKKSQLQQNRSTVYNTFYETNSLMKKQQNIPYQSDNKKTKFSQQFSMGKQKEKLKSERWKMIEDKINAIKGQNQSLKANLHY